MPISICFFHEVPKFIPNVALPIHLHFLINESGIENFDVEKVSIAFKPNLNDRYWLLYDQITQGMVLIERIEDGVNLSFHKNKKF